MRKFYKRGCRLTLFSQIQMKITARPWGTRKYDDM